MQNKINEPVEATHLGKKSEFPEQYDASVLVAVPRYENRKIYNIEERPSIFVGKDVWHAYELGFLTEIGLPVTGMLKLVYGADNLFLVESKSLKLYLNSFNMSNFGKNRQEGIEEVLTLIKADLDKCLGTNVDVSFMEDGQEKKLDFNDFDLLEQHPDAELVDYTHFNESPELLESVAGKVLKVGSHLLRSNCKITHQPDWGSVYINIEGESIPSKMSLLKYLVSFRNENHFHEEVCEMIYKRLYDVFSPKKLMVACLFTRRGGIDICPVRASHESLLPTNLIDVDSRDCKLIRQ
ncbi:NADPH-dependent 7-cyano-7-deazaguanine reductase QueF [Prolixibacteraceae bacterium JC049]|nr:NADPH-dependent 7-cyano-7-deazaguanine reductase QueF [Prolixibacteraceae bacterium JC049]